MIEITLSQTKISPSPSFINFFGGSEKTNSDRMKAQHRTGEQSCETEAGAMSTLEPHQRWCSGRSPPSTTLHMLYLWEARQGASSQIFMSSG